MGAGASSKQVRRYKSDTEIGSASSGSPAPPSTAEVTGGAITDEAPNVKRAHSTGRLSWRSKRLSAIKTAKPVLTPNRGAASSSSRDRAIRFTKDVASEYLIGDELMPSTNFGTTVYNAKRLSDGMDVVVKVRLKAESFPTGEEVHKAWRVTTEYLLNLPRNDNITQLYDVLEDKTAYYVVMEKVEGLDLFETLYSPEKPARDAVRLILKQLLEAVALLHAQGYIHRDLKLENVMLDQSPKSSRSTERKNKNNQSACQVGTSVSQLMASTQQSSTKCAESTASSCDAMLLSDAQNVSKVVTDAGGDRFNVVAEAEEEEVRGDAPIVKLIDFDTVEVYSPKNAAKVVMGTDMYIAHEAYNGHYSPASDVFAIGVIAYKLLSGKFPFTDSVFGEGGDNTVGSPNMLQTRDAIKSFEINWSRPPFDTDKLACDLCKSMLARTDTDRPTAQQAVEHLWFSKIVTERVE